MNIFDRERTRKNLWFAYFSLLVCWSLNSYAQLLGFLRDGTLFGHIDNGSLIVNDFTLAYNDARLAAQCATGPINIYDPIIQQAGVIAIMAPLVPDKGWYNQYPPMWFALIKPMAWLTLSGAWIAWCGLSFICILIGLWFLSQEMGRAKFSRIFFTVSTIGMYPTWYAFYLGQATLMHFPALIAFWLLLRCRKFFLAGLVSVAFLIKLQYLPFLLLIGLILGRTRYLIGFILASAITMVYTLSVVGWQNIVSYPEALLHIEEVAHGTATQVMQNWKGQLSIFIANAHELKSITYVIYLIGIVMALVSWTWLLRRLGGANDRRAFAISVSITTFVMILCSPHTHIQDYLTVAVAPAFLYPVIKRAARGDKLISAIKWCFWIFPAYSWVALIYFVFFVQMKIQPFFLWALIVLSLLLLKTKNLLQQKS